MHITQRYASVFVAVALAATGCSSEVPSSQHTSSMETGTTPERVPGADCYGAISSDANKYKDSPEARHVIETQLGLTADDIQRTTHDFQYHQCTEIKEYASALSSFAQPPTPTGEVIKGLMNQSSVEPSAQQRMSPYFVAYAAKVVKKFEELSAFRAMFAEAGMTPERVTLYIQYPHKENWDPPQPDQVIALHKLLKERSDECRMKVVYNMHDTQVNYVGEITLGSGSIPPSYSWADIIKLGNHGIFPSECIMDGDIQAFRRYGITNADSIIKHAETYGSNIPHVLDRAQLVLSDLPLVRRIGTENVSNYAAAGFAGNKTAMTYLFTHGVDGNTAIEFKAYGIYDLSKMAYLRQHGMTKQTMDEMCNFGFLNRIKLPYSLGEMLIANTAYREHRAALREAGILQERTQQPNSSSSIGRLGMSQ